MKNEEGVNCGNMYSLLSSCVSLDAVTDSLHLNCSGGHTSGRHLDFYSSSVVSCFSLLFITRDFGVGV